MHRRLALALALAAGCVIVRAPDDRAPEVCDNGVDDDFDGDVDCEDADCRGACEQVEEVCGDGLDNDGDGLADCEDPACAGSCVERCDDGDDNDGDGLADCEDADCEALCDQDGDGFASAAVGGDDCDDADPDVHPGVPEDCGDGVDQDCDRDVDCDDADCASELVCLPCAELVLPPGTPQTASGSTGGSTNEHTGSCGGGSAPDEAWLWAPTVAGTYTFDTAGSAHDTVLYVLDGCAGAELACNDDAIGLQSEVTVTLAAGQPVLIVVDGYNTAAGSYTLNVY